MGESAMEKDFTEGEPSTGERAHTVGVAFTAVVSPSSLSEPPSLPTLLLRESLLPRENRLITIGGVGGLCTG